MAWSNFLIYNYEVQHIFPNEILTSDLIKAQISNGRFHQAGTIKAIL